jgi:hypothetical protein
MTIAAGPFVLGATLLVIGGVLKAWRPVDTANALRGVGLPGGSWLVRVGGAFEVAVGAVALAVGDRLVAALVAASYAGFAAFVGAALARDAPISSCACFGRADTPPSRAHVVVNVVLAVAATVVAVDPPASLREVVAGQPLAGIPFVLLVIAGVVAVFLALSTLPRTLAMAQRRPGS